MSECPTNDVPGSESSVGVMGGGDGLVVLTPLAHRYLDQTRPWVRLVSIMAFVAAGLMVVVGTVMLVIALVWGVAGRPTDAIGQIGGVVVVAMMAVSYIGLAIVYVAPGVYLARYASAIKRLQASGNAGALEDALKHQKSFWRFVGILTAIGAVLMLVGLVLGLVAGAVAAVMAGRS